jgi:hypothetical protein
MSRIAMAPGDGLSNTLSDAALAALYRRLADETTGMVRTTLLKLANEAQTRHCRNHAEVIDLHLVPNMSRLSPDVVRTYA